MALRTDLAIVQLPSTPDFGGLIGRNKSNIDPDFKTEVVRITDASDSNNMSMQTSDTGAAIIWNCNDTMLLCRSTGGASYLYQFDPVTMTAKNLSWRIKGKVCFSRVIPGVLYQLLDNHKLDKITFKKVLGGWAYQSTITLTDFTKVLPTGFNVNWVSSFMGSLDDSTFMAGFSEGVQNTAFLSVVFRKNKGLRILNTDTGMITGDWGALGAAVITSPDPTVAFPFLMHECSMTPNPSFGNIGKTTADNSSGGHLIWEIDTLDLRDTNISGHAAKGYLNYYAGGPGGGQVKELSYKDPTQTRLVIPTNLLPSGQTPPQHYDGDQHFGFGKIDKLDNSVFWITSKSKTGNNGIPGKGFTSCWMGEVRGVNAQTGIVQRACHTFNSEQSTEFIVQYSMAVPSQTGKFVAFCSDMMGTLGSTSGNPTSNLGKDARGDVFVVKVG